MHDVSFGLAPVRDCFASIDLEPASHAHDGACAVGITILHPVVITARRSLT